jgi:hypothetical protein
MTTTTNEPTYLMVDGYQLLFIANPADPKLQPQHWNASRYAVCQLQGCRG